MSMLTNIILSVILAAILGGAITYVAFSKKRGKVCIGCPYAKECTRCQGSCATKPRSQTADAVPKIEKE